MHVHSTAHVSSHMHPLLSHTWAWEPKLCISPNQSNSPCSSICLISYALLLIFVRLSRWMLCTVGAGGAIIGVEIACKKIK